MLPTVFSKFWIEKRKESRTKKPKTALNPTELITPRGALQAALRVSSDKCALASKPVSVYCAMSAPQQARYAGEARDTPSWISRSIVERRKDEFRGLVGWRFGQNGDCERGYASGMQKDGGIVQVAQDVHTERVDSRMRYEKRRVDTNCLPRGGFVGRLHGRKSRNQASASEGDARGDCDLSKEVEPGLSACTLSYP